MRCTFNKHSDRCPSQAVGFIVWEHIPGEQHTDNEAELTVYCDDHLRLMVKHAPQATEEVARAAGFFGSLVQLELRPNVHEARRDAAFYRALRG